MVTGPLKLICFLNRGIALPLLPRTFPNLTMTNLTSPSRAIFPMKSSATRFEAPITLVGFTALSVEINTNLSAPYLTAARATFFVPRTLFLIASSGWASIRGTCLCAAAWKTI